MVKYTTETTILIQSDDFYRHGWELSKADTIAFGRIVESRAKFIMRNIVSMYTAYMSTKKAIFRFQEKFGYTENIWPYDSIKQDFFRNGAPLHHDLNNEIVEKIENIFLDNLSNLGTICPQYILNYDNHNKKHKSAIRFPEIIRYSPSKRRINKRGNIIPQK